MYDMESLFEEEDYALESLGYINDISSAVIKLCFNIIK